MKNILITASFILFCNVCSFSQSTKFNIFIGGEATKLEDDYGDDVKVFLNEGYKAYSYLVGVELEQPLLFDFDLLLKSSFVHKHVKDVTDQDFVDGGPPFSITFPHLYNSILLRRNIYKQLKIGGGISYNLFKPSSWLHDGYEKELTGILESSLNIRRFNINLSYAFGFENVFLERENYFIFHTKPSKSFQLTVGYRLFNYVWKKRGKKVNCPSI